MGSRKNYNSRGHVNGYTTKNKGYYADRGKPKKVVYDSENYHTYNPPKRYAVHIERRGAKNGERDSGGIYECDTFDEVKKVLRRENAENHSSIYYRVNDNSRTQYDPDRIKQGYNSSYRGAHCIASGNIIGNDKHKIATTFDKKYFNLD